MGGIGIGNPGSLFLFLGFVLYIFTVMRDLFWDVFGAVERLQFLLGHYCVGILESFPSFCYIFHLSFYFI